MSSTPFYASHVLHHKYGGGGGRRSRKHSLIAARMPLSSATSSTLTHHAPSSTTTRVDRDKAPQQTVYALSATIVAAGSRHHFDWLLMRQPSVSFQEEWRVLRSIQPSTLLDKIYFAFDGYADGTGVPVTFQSQYSLVRKYLATDLRGFPYRDIVVHFTAIGYPGLVFPAEIAIKSGDRDVTRQELAQRLIAVIHYWHERVPRRHNAVDHNLAFVSSGRGVQLKQMRLSALRHLGGREFQAELLLDPR